MCAHRILSFAYLRIETNGLFDLGTQIGDACQVIQRIHRVLSAGQQILEIVPRCVEVILPEIDNRHQAQRISTIGLLEQNLVDLAQCIFITTGRQK